MTPTRAFGAWREREKPEEEKARGRVGTSTHQVGQRDHHKGVPGPDVQVVRVHGKLEA